MKFTDLVVLFVIVLLNIFFWTSANLPQQLAEPSGPIQSFSYNPYGIDQGPEKEPKPSEAQMDHDLQVISSLAKTIRIYGSDPLFQALPRLAEKYRMNVIAAAWINHDKPSNDKQVEAAIQLARFNRNIKRVLIGNETQLSTFIGLPQIITREELVAYLREARSRLKTPVSTAEPWDYWLKDPELVNEVDFIAIHSLPYWMGVPIDQAVDYVVGNYLAVKNRFPNKFVYVAETGWPSDGPQRGNAIASLVNQARFVREFIVRAKKENISYNLVEAFDQPWKSEREGHVGEYWGIWDAYRKPKFPIEGTVVEDVHWKKWAFFSSFMTITAALLILSRKRALNLTGKTVMFVMIQLVSTAVALVARQISSEYLSNFEIIFWAIMIIAQVVMAVIFLTDTVEVADVIGHRPFRKKYPPLTAQPKPDADFVSIHLACCKEPPDMVILTLDSLAQLNYPNFEVIVVDNNTPDPKQWEPIKAHCEKLGPRFRFFSLGKWPGFKAGALNFALKQTDPRAKVVGVVDADYLVETNWLQATIPYFADRDIAVVQAPQEHRDFEKNTFLQMENDEFTGFFRIGMVQRNEYNAIIQHGTMTLVNRKMLNEVKGWSEWCIGEDTELGLRLLLKGKRCIYIDACLGRGLVPDSFEAYAKQRFRWAYGGARIFRRYIGHVLGHKKGLNLQQRYRFFRDWLSWGGGSFLHLVFTLLALFWSSVLLSNPQFTDFPYRIFIYPAIALMFVKVFGVYWTYRVRVPISRKRTILSMLAGGALTHSVAKAVFQGLFLWTKVPFLRTPKMARSAPVLRSLLMVWQEAALMLALWIAGISVLITFTYVRQFVASTDAALWCIVLLVQSLPYLCAVIVSVMSSVKSVRANLRVCP